MMTIKPNTIQIHERACKEAKLIHKPIISVQGSKTREEDWEGNMRWFINYHDHGLQNGYGVANAEDYLIERTADKLLGYDPILEYL